MQHTRQQVIVSNDARVLETESDRGVEKRTSCGISFLGSENAGTQAASSNDDDRRCTFEKRKKHTFG